MSSSLSKKKTVIAAASSTAKKMLHIIGLDVVKRSTLLAFERALAENTARFAANDAQMALLHAALEASNTAVVQRDATIDDLRKRITKDAETIASYSAKDQELNSILADYQLKLERKPDYQVVMAQDQLRAGMVNLDPDFLELYVKCREYTMTSWERLYALYKAIYY